MKMHGVVSTHLQECYVHGMCKPRVHIVYILDYMRHVLDIGNMDSDIVYCEGK